MIYGSPYFVDFCRCPTFLSLVFQILGPTNWTDFAVRLFFRYISSHCWAKFDPYHSTSIPIGLFSLSYIVWLFMMLMVVSSWLQSRLWIAFQVLMLDLSKSFICHGSLAILVMNELFTIA